MNRVEGIRIIELDESAHVYLMVRTDEGIEAQFLAGFPSKVEADAYVSGFREGQNVLRQYAEAGFAK